MRYPWKRELSPSEAKIADLIRLVEKGTDETRDRACEELLEIGTEATETIVKAVTNERRMSTAILWCYIAFDVCIVIGLIVLKRYAGLLGAITSIGFFLSAISNARALSTKQSHLLRTVARIEDIRITGLLLEMRKHTVLQPAVDEALLKMLTRVQRGDFWLTKPQREALHEIVAMYDHAWMEAGFTALGRIGDQADLTLLSEHLQAAEGRYAEADWQQAAQRCCEQIREHLEADLHRSTLLRASRAYGDEEAVLLRPAADAGSQPDQLLRAAPADPVRAESSEPT